MDTNEHESALVGRGTPWAPLPGSTSGAHGVTRPTREIQFVSIRVHSWLIY
ncbi:MAG: hypothetical protein AAB380_03810 [Verrucomicrobiota bacterium]